MPLTSLPTLTPKQLKRVTAHYPQWHFVQANRFAWSPTAQTIFFDAAHPDAPQLLLHELAHAILNHHTYSRDVQLIAMEAAAWDKAQEIAPAYSVVIAQETVQDHLDSYRQWLHARSSCPACSATGYQTTTRSYRCPACLHTWRVNEARSCALRRCGQTDKK